MTAPPAVGLGVTLSVLAESETASAAQVVPSSPVGDHTSIEDVLAFALYAATANLSVPLVLALVVFVVAGCGVGAPGAPVRRMNRLRPTKPNSSQTSR